MDTIARFEKRGTLTTFNITTDQWHEFDGWFMLHENGRTVTMRKIGGRKHYLLCHISDVWDFQQKADK